MSGFDTGWLALREPADRAARDRALLGAAASHLDQAGEPVVVDIGCGMGSTLRAFAPLVGRRVRWRLVDHDEALLAEAHRRTRGQADVSCERADLAEIEALELPKSGLVTASALFDLVSRDFVERLADRLAGSALGLYAALNYNGEIGWKPGVDEDGTMVAAFNRHQTGDKGFGPALGPGAAEALMAALEARGYRVMMAPSPWEIGADAADLHNAFLDGMIDAVGETGDVKAAALEVWAARRRAAIGERATCRVGHFDVLALPA